MKAIKLVLVVAIMALLPAITWAAPGAGGGLAGTAHDFTVATPTGTGGNTETFAVGLCTFCHTPHRAIQTELLWNHTLSTSTFSWDIPSTTAGTKYPSFKGDTYKGPTAKCLSCHDGTVAIGDVAWFGEGKPAAPLNTDKHAWPDVFNVGARDGVAGNMTGNHPVAMPYPYGNGKNTYNKITTGDQAELTEWQAAPLSPIRVFHDDGSNITAGPASGTTGIECSSCHDPHNKQSVDDLFLRGTIGGNVAGTGANYLCLKCHVK